MKDRNQEPTRDDLVEQAAKLVMEKLPRWKALGVERARQHYRSFKEHQLRSEIRDLQRIT